VKPKSKKKVDTTVETEGIEQEVVETTQENTDVDDETQKALDILSALMGN
jgi:SOS response regulatory protein OraA/RecX